MNGVDPKDNRSMVPTSAAKLTARSSDMVTRGLQMLMDGENDVVLLDVTPLSIGFETSGGVYTRLIEKNTIIPTSKSHVFTTDADNQTTIEIILYQDEVPIARHNKLLGRFNITNIPPAPQGIPRIEVSFNIEINGIVTVKAEDLGTKHELPIVINETSDLIENEIESPGWGTALHKAALDGNIQIAQALIEKGVDVNVRDLYFRTPLHIAAQQGDVDFAQLLLSNHAYINGADYDFKEHIHTTPLHFAAGAGEAKMVAFLIDAGAAIDAESEYGTPLQSAIRGNHSSTVELLISKGADTNKTSHDGWIPLHYAAFHGCIEKDEHECGGIVELLLATGVEIDRADDFGWTPMHWAAVHGHRTTLEFLVSNGANVNVKTKCNVGGFEYHEFCNIEWPLISREPTRIVDQRKGFCYLYGLNTDDDLWRKFHFKIPAGSTPLDITRL